ncbi:MAG TPA: hypothetical protein VGA37_15665 [Gemmatimonadales bacterium]
MNVQRILREGLIAGLIGAAAVACWFFLVDLVAGRVFFTPAMLGSATFWGVHDPEAVAVTFQAVIAYTMLHVVAFGAVGLVAAMLAALVDSFPSTLFIVVVFFAIFEVGFYIVVATMAQPLLGALAWSNVAIGNLIAAGGMGFYLWRVHPRIREVLALHPLGETADGE